MTHLLSLLFFGFVMGLAVAAIWSVLAEDWHLVKANMPWRSTKADDRPRALLVRQAFKSLGHA